MAHHNIWLFLLYGPASRLAMSVLLFVGLLSYRRPPDDIVERSNPRKWLIWIALFLAVDLVVAWIANSAFAGPRPLTGIGNRRQFIACTQAEIARAKRSGTALSLLSLDLDHFKRINDRYGHPGGDSVLCEFAQKCLEAIRPIRPYDLVARVGGEEFMETRRLELCDRRAGLRGIGAPKNLR
jgi:hypothetical protein